MIKVIPIKNALIKKQFQPIKIKQLITIKSRILKKYFFRNGRPVDLTRNGRDLVVSEQTESVPIVVKANLTNSGEYAFDVRVSIFFNNLITWKGVSEFKKPFHYLLLCFF